MSADSLPKSGRGRAGRRQRQQNYHAQADQDAHGGGLKIDATRITSVRVSNEDVQQIARNATNNEVLKKAPTQHVRKRASVKVGLGWSGEQVHPNRREIECMYAVD